jgi:prepilin-type N-terminal cleavage/methylation domain-containing protein
MRHAFSLVELSIVLVILGLLTGGVLGGQALIRAAELRSVGTEHARYVTAVQTFRDKYFGLPGDITNASSFWGALDGNNGIGSDCRGESASLLTCNGNGDGSICPDAAACASSTWETYLFWKHLANAGLIEGNYSGSSARSTGTPQCFSSSGNSVPGCNAAASKISRGMWNVEDMSTQTAHPYLFSGNYGNTLALTTGPNFINYINATVEPEELWNIDTKIDDGKPAFGNVVASRWNTCATGAANVNDGANASYNLQDGTIRCVPVFRNAF